MSELRRESEMGNETAEGTTVGDVTDEAAKAAAEAIAKAASTEDKSGEESKEGETPAGDEAAEDELVVTIGDEAPPQEEEEVRQAPEWVRELRKTNRELARRNKELEKAASEKAAPATATTLGPKPKLADFDFDTDKFEEALTKWNDQKRAIDSESIARQAEERKAQEAWQARLGEYGESKAKLKVKDFDEAEASVFEAFSPVQQGIAVQGAENPGLVIYAIGKNPKKLKELAAITDPVKFAFAVARLEKDLKMTTRKAPPPPEKVVTGSAPKSGVVDSQLDKLRADAEKTGDYTKVTAYKRQKRAASA